jgi:hypothetical protein
MNSMTFSDFLEQKFIEWQMQEKGRKTIVAFKEDHSDQQQKVDEKLASDASQLAAVRKGIANTVNAIALHGHSKALSKRLASLEEQETQLEAGIMQLKRQSIAPIQMPTLEQARANAHKIQGDLRSKDPLFIRQTLLSIISEVYIDRTDKELLCQVNFYVKKKPPDRTVSLFHAPVGAPLYRHSISFAGTIPPSGRPKKKPFNW